VERSGFDPLRLLDGLARDLDPPSVVAIIEPALRQTGRELLRLHDAALASGLWRVLAPCTHQRSCPLLTLRDRPWCHFHFRWDAPPFVRAVADPLGLRYEEPSLAFLILERVEAGESAEERRERIDGREERGGPTDLARAIGDRMPVRDKGEGIYVCSVGERSLLVDPPEGMGRGDLVRLRAPGPEGGTRGGRSSATGAPGGTASVVRPWARSLGGASKGGDDAGRSRAGEARRDEARQGDTPPLDAPSAER
jgi:hypothetical protein